MTTNKQHLQGMAGGKSGAIVTVSGLALLCVRGLEHLFGVELPPEVETELVLAATAGISLVVGAVPDGLRLLGWDRTAEAWEDAAEDKEFTRAEGVQIAAAAYTDEFGGER